MISGLNRFWLSRIWFSVLGCYRLASFGFTSSGEAFGARSLRCLQDQGSKAAMALTRPQEAHKRVEAPLRKVHKAARGSQGGRRELCRPTRNMGFGLMVLLDSRVPLPGYPTGAPWGTAWGPSGGSPGVSWGLPGDPQGGGFLSRFPGNSFLFDVRDSFVLFNKQCL